MSEPFIHDEPCEVCGENAPKNDRLTRTVEVSYGHFHVCKVCEPKLPREWQHDPEDAFLTFDAEDDDLNNDSVLERIFR